MTYLIVPSGADAAARSAEAWQALGTQGGVTTALWGWRTHPTGPQAALIIPPTPEAAQIDMPQAAYDALLTADERGALVETLPEDWIVDVSGGGAG